MPIISYLLLAEDANNTNGVGLELRNAAIERMMVEQIPTTRVIYAVAFLDLQEATPAGTYKIVGKLRTPSGELVTADPPAGTPPSAVSMPEGAQIGYMFVPLELHIEEVGQYRVHIEIDGVTDFAETPLLVRSWV